MSKDDYELMRQWFEGVVVDNKQKDEVGIELIDLKYKHTFRVVNWGKKIMDGGNEVAWDYLLGETVCLLHDVGRFPQAKFNSLDDGVTIDHAKMGEKMWRNNGLLEGKEIKEVIAEAIGQHNNPNFSGDNKYVKLARDADQLAIMSELEDQISGKSKWATGEIAETIVDSFRNNRVIDSKETRTVGEWMLMAKSWSRRFNFKATSELYCDEGFEKIINDKYCQLFPDRAGFWRDLEIEGKFKN